ncbi:MAG: ABC transporter ATP-binding protein [Candidatus Pacebacteria bacterium]|nr:ABC transporter ATP-binding protein [Candidatus Paceibacterota bacterium]
MNNTEPLIKLDNVSLAHNLGQENELWSLKNVSVEIYPQEHIVFFGPSGCGKSSLLNAIAGLERPTKGTVMVNGTDLTKLSKKKMIHFHQSTVGMIFQAYFLIPHLSAKDNIILPQLFAKKSRSKRLEQTKRLMDRFGITDFQKRRPAMLSGGQQQRVAIARALANDPTILLADEPAGNLDSNNTYIVLNLLSEFKQADQKTIIHVTHNPGQLHYADRVFYMKDGKINKIVVNPRPGVSRREEITEFEYLEQAHPYLKESEVISKILLNRMISPFGIETKQRIEQVMSQYVEKKIDEREMLYLLDEKPIDLYKQTAHEFTKDMIKTMRRIDSLRNSDGAVQTKTSEEKAALIRSYLLEDYSGILSIQKVKRLEDILIKRIDGKITANGMQDLLDWSYKRGGVGLNSRTATNFRRDIEVILMKRA